jgi:hypothetical protein
MNAKIISEGGYVLGTQVVLEDGTELQGVSRVTFTADVKDGVCRIDAELAFGEIEADGKLTVWGTHPLTGVHGPIAKVIFADGTEWAAP